MDDTDDSESLIKSLFRDLEIPGETEALRSSKDLRAEFGELLKLPPSSFQEIALDLAVVAGVSGDWILALEATNRLAGMLVDRLDIKLWQLRSLVELQRFAEALAISHSIRWKSEHLIHVNFLTGLSFEGLGMRDQAKLRFEAVQKIDPTYRAVAERLLSI